MRIMIETTAPLSATDHQILSLLLLARHDAEPPAEGAKAPKISGPAPVQAPERITAETIDTSAVTVTLGGAAEAEEIVPDTVTESVQPEQDQPVTEETMDAAVAEAKKLMQGGNKTKIRSALETVGLAKVGAVETEGQALALLAALKG